MVTPLLSPKDQAAITEAVTEAEARTSGEIVCVIAARVSAYRETPLAFAALAALALPLLLIAAGFDPSRLADLPGAWTAANEDPRRALTTVFAAYAALQAAVFVITGFIVNIPPVRRALTPRWLKHRRVGAAALGQLAHAAQSAGPHGAAIVVFASRDDRIVDVVTTPAVHQVADPSTWSEAVAAAQAGLRRGAPGDGLSAALRLCGAALARHFPGNRDDANRSPDAPLEI